MLCQFTFKNFKSYKDETIFDFQAATLPEFKETLITAKSAPDLVPVSAVYGPNGGGKSNLLQALSCVISTIVKPVHELGKNRQSLILQQKVDAIPFLFDEVSANDPTEFKLFFLIGSNLYCYYIALKEDEVISESLTRKSVTGKKAAELFDREKGKITLGYSINKKSINTDVNPKMPYLSFLAINYDIPEISEVMTWFESCIIRSYANPMVEHQIMLEKYTEYKNQFIQALNDMDINRYGAQLLFTSHDMSTMKNTIFRRDEIWFAADNEAHESDVYSLHEMRSKDGSRIKNTATYDKQYLEGRYGADPYLRNMLGGAFA